MNSFKPTGYNSLSPYFIVQDSERWIELLKDVFGAEVKRRFDRGDGTLMHGEVQIDDSVVMVSEATEQYPANRFLLHVYVPDAIATYEAALKAGCKPIQAPKKLDSDPDLRGQFEDFAGNVWAVGTQMED